MRNVLQLSPRLIVRPGPGPSIGPGYVYTSTHVSIKTVYNACVWDSSRGVIVCDREAENESGRQRQIIKIWQIFKILRDLLGLNVDFFHVSGAALL